MALSIRFRRSEENPANSGVAAATGLLFCASTDREIVSKTTTSECVLIFIRFYVQSLYGFPNFSGYKAHKKIPALHEIFVTFVSLWGKWHER
jgi:hypothetical protein